MFKAPVFKAENVVTSLAKYCNWYNQYYTIHSGLV